MVYHKPGSFGMQASIWTRGALARFRHPTEPISLNGNVCPPRLFYSSPPQNLNTHAGDRADLTSPPTPPNEPPDGKSLQARTVLSRVRRATVSPSRNSHTSENLEEKIRFTLRTLRPELVTRDDLLTLPPMRWNIRFTSDFFREPAACLNPHFLGLATSEPRPGKEKRGFLYYAPPPDDLPPFAGEIRFRIVPGERSHSLSEQVAQAKESGSSLFESSSDYLLHPTYHWRLPLLAIAWNRVYDPFRTLLLREGLVSESVMKWAAGAGAKNRVQRTSAIIHSLEQPFIWDAGWDKEAAAPSYARTQALYCARSVA